MRILKLSVYCLYITLVVLEFYIDNLLRLPAGWYALSGISCIALCITYLTNNNRTPKTSRVFIERERDGFLFTAFMMILYSTINLTGFYYGSIDFSIHTLARLGFYIGALVLAASIIIHESRTSERF